MVGVPLYGTPISTTPPAPKPADAVPVAASSAISRVPARKTMRGASLPAPGQ
jgi:hypothetical protein